MTTTYPKFFHDFLKLQQTEEAPKPQIRRPPKSGRPPVADEPLSFDYIVSKKPGNKKVLKYIQTMIDEIVAENDA